MKLVSFTRIRENFQNIPSDKKNPLYASSTAKKILLVSASIILLGFAIRYAYVSLFGRVTKKQKLHSSSGLSGIKQNKRSDETIVHPYSGDLTAAEKSKIKAKFSNDYLLNVKFEEFPSFHVTIRREDLFKSQAQVIVNAANIHLGGGGGIDGAIHEKGGSQYKNEHQELQKRYRSNYTSGYAAMIGSGLLKKEYKIENVIVVAGPQGETDQQKENALYSCYYNSLVLANKHEKTSIAFPSISTGIFKFPTDRASSIALKAIYDFMHKFPEGSLKAISIHFLPKNHKSNLITYQKAASCSP